MATADAAGRQPPPPSRTLDRVFRVSVVLKGVDGLRHGTAVDAGVYLLAHGVANWLTVREYRSKRRRADGGDAAGVGSAMLGS